MLIPPENLRHYYNELIQNSLNKEKQGTTIYIFVTNEADSLCALKMLTNLLKTDEIQYNCIPVFSNIHLINEINNLESNVNVRTLIFINCGGLFDQTSLWYYKKTDYKINAFIFDAHRPFFHNNLIDPLGKICIINDECKSFSDYPKAEDMQILQECQDIEDSEEDEEYDSDEEEIKEELEDLKNSSDDEEVYGGDKADRKASNDDEDAEIIGPDEDIDEVKVGTKRQRDGDKIVDRRQLKRQKKALFHRYYSGTFYHKSSSWAIYQIYQALNRTTNDSLWMWILGMTDLIVHAKAGSYSFDNDVIECSNEVQRLNPHIYNKYEDMQPHYDDPESGENQPVNQTADKDLFKYVNILSRNKEIGSIMMEQDLKLMLLRHWSLFESLCNSNYLVSKMELWKEPGQKELKRLLATLGISLEQAKQKFNYMEPTIRNEFKQKFLENAHFFNLDNIAINTFIRQIDPKTQLSAYDMVYALSSIIECPRNLSKKEFQNFSASEEQKQQRPFESQNMLQGRISSSNQINPNSKDLTDADVQSAHDCKYANFWVAYDALDKMNKGLLDMGIELAKEMQKAIVQIGTSIIDKKEVKVGNGFRYVMIDNDFLRDVQLFQYPLALQKLALFVMETYQVKKARSKDKPLLIAVKNTKKGTTLIVAVIGLTRDSDYIRNDFGQRFRQVTVNTGVVTKHDGFDSAIIEVKNEDYRPFIEELSNLNE